MARININDLEIERNSDPFEIEVDDTVYVFNDPKSLSLDRLMTLINATSAEDQLSAMMKDGDFQKLKANPKVDGYAFTEIIKQYRLHYKIVTPGEAPA